MSSRLPYKAVVALVCLTVACGCLSACANPLSRFLNRAPASQQTMVTAPDMIEISDAEASAGLLSITDADRKNIFDEYGITLEKMSTAEATELVEGLQSIKRTKILHEDGFDYLAYPDLNYKNLYNDVVAKTSVIGDRDGLVEFSGSKTSELNATLAENPKVLVVSDTLDADETVKVPSGAVIVADGCAVVYAGAERAFDAQGVDGFAIEGFDIEGAFGYGIYIENASGFAVRNCSFSGISFRALALVRAADTFAVENCEFSNNAHGGIFASGNIHDGIFQKNSIHDNQGFANDDAGLFIGRFKHPVEGSAETEFWEPDQTELVDAPNHLLIVDNDIHDNISQGVYSHAGWDNFIVGNNIENNHKEGACLDFGTTTTYVYENRFVSNGWRIGVADGEPEFNKLPGLSMDNACYNIIRANLFSNNGGSGIKAVRASCRNTIIENSVADNNGGVSENGHFFGVELAGDLNPDYEGAKGLDFAPCYENTVAANTICGAHYAGVYLGGGAYMNIIRLNTILGASDWSVESHSDRANDVSDNIANMPEFRNGQVLG